MKMPPVSVNTGVASTGDHTISSLPSRLNGQTARRGIESGDVLTGGDTACDRKVALDEVRLGGHILVHPAPTVFLHDEVIEIERGVVISRIDGDHRARKHRLEKILRRFRRILRADPGGIVGISKRVALSAR